MIPDGMDPFTADVRTLLHLPGIGPKLARTLHHRRVLELDSSTNSNASRALGQSGAGHS